MRYFSEFPTLFYTFDPNKQEFKSVIDIFARVRMLDSIINNISVYYNYNMKESDTIEGIAHKYYGDPQRHWIIMFTNRVLDPYYDVPVNQEVLQQKIINNYGSVAAAMSNVHHIELRTTTISTRNDVSNTNVQISTVGTDVTTINGVTALPNTANPIVTMGVPVETVMASGYTITTSQVLVAVSDYDYEIQLNEDHRKIKLIKKDFVNQIEGELKNLLSK